jgi:hypothetical protein
MQTLVFNVMPDRRLTIQEPFIRCLVSAALILGLCHAPIAAADDGGCSAETVWFPHGQTPRPDDAAFQSTSNCVFHQWSWQMFLWLTQEVDGAPRFLSFVSPQSLLGMQQRGMFPRMTKSATPESFDEYLQAGTDGILVDLNGRAVYYSQYVNATFADFITSKGLTDPAKVRALEPTTEFPITDHKGSLELKASWKIVAEGEDVSDMFTMTTEVAKMVNRGGKIVIDPTQTEPARVALVGFHIGGVVQGHPEMIWATFEHKDNAPNVPAAVTPETKVADRDFTFYTAGTSYGNCNLNPASSGLLRLDESTQMLTPATQVCRRYQFGNDPDSSSSSVQTNDANIASLNASVAQKLDDRDVWKNYVEVGAIWFLDGKNFKPGLNLADDALLTGSLKLSNATIETFTQTQSTMSNCFRCHNTQQQFPPKMSLDPLPPTNLNISHAFQNIYFWSQEAPGGAEPSQTAESKGGEDQ